MDELVAELAALELRRAIANALKQMRAAAELTQRQAAELVGTTQQNLCLLENAKVDARFSTIQRLAYGYGYNLELVFEPFEEEEVEEESEEPEAEVVEPFGRS